MRKWPIPCKIYTWPKRWTHCSTICEWESLLSFPLLKPTTFSLVNPHTHNQEKKTDNNDVEDFWYQPCNYNNKEMGRKLREISILCLALWGCEHGYGSRTICGVGGSNPKWGVEYVKVFISCFYIAGLSHSEHLKSWNSTKAVTL